MPAPPLPEDEQQRIRDALATHGTVAEAARATGRDRGTVFKYTRAASASPEPGRAPPERLDAAAKLALVEKLLADLKAGDGKTEVVPGPPARVVAPGRTNVVTPERRYERVAFVSDLHHPFQDTAAIGTTLAALRDYRPDLLILGGDGFDCFSVSDHDREPGRCDCLQDEFDAARETWRAFDDLGCDVVWLDGNHEERINRMQRRNPGLFRLRALELPRAAELPQRWLYCPDQTRVRLGSLTCLHGNLKGRGTSMMHAAAGMLRKLRTSCVFGHLHRHQMFMETTEDGTYRAGFANGHLSDVAQAHYITAPDWQQGFTTIDYDWSTGVFSVTPRLIVKGRLRWGGTTYGATP